jgi:hypothetical protein
MPTWKKNDRLPAISYRLEVPLGSALDLTDAEIRFIMTSDATGAVKVDALATSDAPTSGVVEYAWAPGDLDTPGSYRAEWRVLMPTGQLITLPDDGYLIITVMPSLSTDIEVFPRDRVDVTDAIDVEVL